jgi:hypothetical protein
VKFGAGTKNRIVFRSRNHPRNYLAFSTLKNGAVSIQAESGVAAKVNGDALGAEAKKVSTDADGKPNLFTFGELQFRIIKARQTALDGSMMAVPTVGPL